MVSPFKKALNRRVLVIDGAMGTQLHAANLQLERDYLGLENCSEIINVSRPEVVGEIHSAYLAAGCDAVETNTFGGSALVLEEFGLGDRTREINEQAARIAREACLQHSTADKPRYVLGSLGPGMKLATLGQVTYETLSKSYYEQAMGLAAGGVDAFMIETCQDPLQIKAALRGVQAACKEYGVRPSILVSVTMEITGTMLVGTDMAAAMAILDPFPVDLVSLNCATGPREMGDHVRVLGQSCRKKVGVYPNAGLPQLVGGEPVYSLTPAELADWLSRFVEEDGMNLVGGCCGTTPEHMRAVAEALGERAPTPRKPAFTPQVSSVFSGVSLLQENSTLLIGERSNANGSKAFREHLLAENIEGMVQMGRDQVHDGSHVLDVCAAYVGRDEKADMTRLIERYRTEVSVPLMIDSTETETIEAALKLCGGRCIVNSINLEDGLEKCERILPLVREHGAAVVALTIDEDGMAKTSLDKIRIARRLYDICTVDYGLRPEDILFDVLTFTICTGNEDDRRLGLETLEGIHRVREELPGVGLLLGLSNISFGLNPAARHVLNSVYLHHAQEAGLTAAILHSARIEPLHHIDKAARELAEDLIFDRRREGYDPLQEFMALFDGVSLKEKKAARHIPEDLGERLAWRIVEGEKEGLGADLDVAIRDKSPVEVINDELLSGMATVGDLFGRGEMQLPFVLRSAETMKAAVAHLEPHMLKETRESRGKILLATVRGDVHDIGKNLVDIILSNNGFDVVNLGIKQPISAILEAAEEHQPDAIGMSGLLVKSTVVMRENLQEMQRRELQTPVLLGGAALNRKFVEQDCREVYDGPVYYSKDAFRGLETMRLLTSEEAPEAAPRARVVEEATQPVEPLPSEIERSQVALLDELPKPPFYGRRVVEAINLQSLIPYVNQKTLFQFQWGYRRKGSSAEEYERSLVEEIRPLYFDLLKQCARDSILQPRAAYGYWSCLAEGDDLVLLDPDDQAHEVARLGFPRQRGKKGLCISDYFSNDVERLDVVGLQAVTIGSHASDVEREWFAEDRYRDYLHLHGLSVEVAEALAEYMHRQLRAELGIAGDDAREFERIFRQDYRGARFSFGYPACPELGDQELVLDLLQAQEIGLEMGEEDQLWPEQSTVAIVVHHPEAKYFTI